MGGVPHMRMRFYIEGPYKKATVHVEVQKVSLRPESTGMYCGGIDELVSWVMGGGGGGS